jgi:hypothetical protein
VGGGDYGDPGPLGDLFKKLRTEPGRYLKNDDLDEIFERGKTHYGYYWRVPPHLNLDGENISLNESERGKNEKDIERWRRDVVQRVFHKLKSMEVTSVVLGCVHPGDFGTYSPPILTFLQLPQRPPVQHYLAYCEELRAWGKHFLQCDSAGKTDQALWVFYQAAYGHKPDSEKMASYRRAFEGDEWVRQRQARNLLGVYFSKYGPLEQATFLLDIDHNLSARIVGYEFEARLKKLIDLNDRERDRKIWRFIEGRPDLKREEWLRAMVEYVALNHLCDPPKEDLDRVRMLRNYAIHAKRNLDKSEVEKMIQTTERLPKRPTL